MKFSCLLSKNVGLSGTRKALVLLVFMALDIYISKRLASECSTLEAIRKLP